MNNSPLIFCVVAWFLVVAAAGISRSEDSSQKASEKTRNVKIVVLDDSDRPLAAAKIHVAVWAKDPAKSNRDYVCDDQGRIAVEVPKEFEIVRIWASADRHVGLFSQWWPKMEQKAHPLPGELTYRLDTGTKIGGVVVSEDGKPIVGAKVEVKLDMPNDMQQELQTNPIPNTWLAYGNAARVTDAEGKWVLENMPAGEEFGVTVMLNHADYVSDERWGGLQFEQDVTIDDFRARTARISMRRGVPLTGIITNADGKPIEGAVVIWGDDPYLQEGSQEVRTDANGMYLLPPQPEGDLNVTVVAEGWAPEQQTVELALPKTTKDFQLKPGKKLRIQFMDKNGKPLRNVGVSIAGWRGNKALYNHMHPNVLPTKIPVNSDKNGVFEWTWAPDDAVVYDFYAKGLEAVTGVEVVPTDEELEIKLLP